MSDLRRTNDIEIRVLIDRVEALEGEFKKFRNEFAEHEIDERMKLELLSASLVSIQVKLDQLLIEIKEPLESYKTAKYGVSFVKYIADTTKWLLPLIIGSVLGYGALTTYQAKLQDPITIEQKGK